MTFAAATASRRPATPSHQPWTPRDYMLRAVEHLTARGAAGLALDPGLGKTSITLAAFMTLQRKGMARTMLVVAPLRVCRTVWRQEGQKWSEFRGLRFSLLHGPKKSERLKEQADVYLINPEGVTWLSQLFFGRSLPFDVVVIDELTKFKNAKSERSKALRPRMARVSRRWGLTGSLAPNGYMDLFGQQLMLDDGAALGKYVTHYRDQYFQVDHSGFDYTLQPGAERRIIQCIAPYWLQMSADDYMELPPLVVDARLIDLEPAARATYAKMKKEMIAELPGGTVTAANAAACYSKLSQMANGAVYLADRSVEHIHDTKLDALEEIVEELNGQPLLVAYEFNHDLDRLRTRFGENLPHLGKGTTANEEAAYIAAWNRNELPILACHPASAGHGLNLQEGSAAHVAWFGITWDLELYDQFIRRIRRSGNVAQRIFNHLLIVRDSIDELKLAALGDKDLTQVRLLKALNLEILRDAETGTDPEQSARETRLDMAITRLSRQADAAPQRTTAAPEKSEVVRPASWGKPSAEVNAGLNRAAAVEDNQRERIATQLRGDAPQHHEVAHEVGASPVAAAARSAFSGAVQSKLQEMKDDHTIPLAELDRVMQDEARKEAEPKRRSSRAKITEASPFTPSDAVIHTRRSLIELVFNSTAFETESVEDGLEICRELQAFIEG